MRRLTVLLLVMSGCPGDAEDDTGGDTSDATSAGSDSSTTPGTSADATTATTDPDTSAGSSATSSTSSTTDPMTSSTGPATSGDTSESDSGAGVCEPDPNGNPCYECVKGPCCDVWTTCQNNEGCTCILQCHVIEGKSLGNCKSTCGSGEEEYKAVFFCGQMSCLGTCEWDCC